MEKKKSNRYEKDRELLGRQGVDLSKLDALEGRDRPKMVYVGPDIISKSGIQAKHFEQHDFSVLHDGYRKGELSLKDIVFAMLEYEKFPLRITPANATVYAKS